VAEQLRDDVEPHLVVAEAGREVMTKIVEVKVHDAGFLDDSAKERRHAARRVRAPPSKAMPL